MLGKIKQAIDELGLVDACLYGLKQFLEKRELPANVYRYVFVAQPVIADKLTPRNRGLSIEVRRVGETDPVLATLPPPEGVIRFRFAQGAVCLGAYKDGDLIGCIWLCLGPYNEDEVRCRFIPLPQGQAAWDFDIYVHPQHRLGFAFSRLWDAANEYLRERSAYKSETGR